MDNDIYNQLISRLKDGNNAIILTQFTGQCGKKEPGMSKRLLDDSECSNIALNALKQGLPVTQSQEDNTTVAEPFFPEERLIVLGGGHIALPLTEFAAKVGFSVTVVDDRPSFANKNRFPLANNVVCDAFEKAVEELKITQNDFVVIITRGHRHDQTCLTKLMTGAEPFYTGMIGSRRRVAVVMDTMIAEGADSGRLKRVHTPIGLSIGAITPEEISISILAELIACKRLKNQDDNRFGNRSDVDFEVLRTLAGNIDEPCSIVTIISSKGSVPRGAGAKMLVYPDGRIIGSIGGGCSEAAVIGNARRIIGTGEYLLQTVDLTGEAAEDEGMVCGGIMQVLIEDF